MSWLKGDINLELEIWGLRAVRFVKLLISSQLAVLSFTIEMMWQLKTCEHGGFFLRLHREVLKFVVSIWWSEWLWPHNRREPCLLCRNVGFWWHVYIYKCLFETLNSTQMYKLLPLNSKTLRFMLCLSQSSASMTTLLQRVDLYFSVLCLKCKK